MYPFYVKEFMLLPYLMKSNKSFQFQFQKIMKLLPTPYWIPKNHKSLTVLDL